MPKPVMWVGTSRDDLKRFPDSAQDSIGYALYLAQLGAKHPDAKPLKGFGGAGVLEVVTDFDGDSFRTVYTARYEEAIYVLHAFQKKSTRGRATPPGEIALVRRRLVRAEAAHRAYVQRLQQSGDRP
ncbi:MAG TPA: type II toxin-antitoxin system RelE/ParE family toxin [Thermomicrobiales bacterium]|nr:type II toxin-antitoxin system RelE/ParE family toxin [Thermomicrobiales bacterium]